MISCEFCGIFLGSFFTEHLLINAHEENTDRNVVLDAAIHYVLSTDRLSTFRIFKSSIFLIPADLSQLEY